MGERLDRCFEFDFDGLFGGADKLNTTLAWLESIACKFKMHYERDKAIECTNLKQLGEVCFKAGKRQEEQEKTGTLREMQPKMCEVLEKFLLDFQFNHPASGKVFKGKNLADFCSFFYDHAVGIQ